MNLKGINSSMIVLVGSNDIYSHLKIKVEDTLREDSILIDKIREKTTNGIVVGILPRLTLYCLNQELHGIFCSLPRLIIYDIKWYYL